MTQPDYIPYQSAGPSESDRAYLNVLSILHYVWGGLTIFFSCFGIIYVVMGAMMMNGNPAFFPTTGPSAGTPLPPTWFGSLFAGMGGCMVLVGWTLGILTIISGRRIAQRRSRVFSYIVAAINCTIVPFGTALGVFTFIMLAKNSVRAMYDNPIRPGSA
jgi:hypothetical protein